MPYRIYFSSGQNSIFFSQRFRHFYHAFGCCKKSFNFIVCPTFKNCQNLNFQRHVICWVKVIDKLLNSIFVWFFDGRRRIFNVKKFICVGTLYFLKFLMGMPFCSNFLFLAGVSPIAIKLMFIFSLFISQTLDELSEELKLSLPWFPLFSLDVPLLSLMPREPLISMLSSLRKGRFGSRFPFFRNESQIRQSNDSCKFTSKSWFTRLGDFLF